MTEIIEATAETVATPAVANGQAPVRQRLTRDAILAAEDITTEDVDVPEWGGFVTVKGLTGRERDQWEAGMWRNAGTKKAKMTLDDTRASLVQKTIVDEHGHLLFSLADIERLTQKSSAPLQRIFLVAQRLSGISDDDIEEITSDLKEGPSAGAG